MAFKARVSCPVSAAREPFVSPEGLDGSAAHARAHCCHDCFFILGSDEQVLVLFTFCIPRVVRLTTPKIFPRRRPAFSGLDEPRRGGAHFGYKMSYPHTRRRVVEATRKPRAELRAIRVIFEPDTDAQEGGAGKFDFMCAYAEADVIIEEIEQTLTSGGLRGIEDDAEDEYLDEIIDGEWGALRAVLKQVGVSTEQLPLAVDREWIEWRT